ncbi:putative nuclease HARBI1 [Dreissena polymorpha]|uniref:putative nuclease HARBI1 n=1 Tax=Dreissena polymorpha TaxID=45954 RepID=UPI0022655565|nr:putative nuclease HARBI1 [Dreissena polymorpha]
MPRRNFRERADVLDKLSNMELVERYRLDRNGILFLNERLEHVISPLTRRNKSLSSIEKILVSLRYFATSNIQLNDGDLHNVSQPTVSRAINDVVEAMINPDIVRQFIYLPTMLWDIRQQKEDFFNIARFPNVIGVVDGTHVQIQAPHVDEPLFVNIMGYHSINAQIMFDASNIIRDIVPRWPGSVHDARILRNSGFFQFMEGNINPEKHQYLLGDSGYPCKRWLLTPFLRPVGEHQNNYNIAHKRTRAVVERGIGQLKRRWGVLHSEIRMEPLKACKVIMCCSVLHNICKARNIPMDDVHMDQLPDHPEDYDGNEDGLHYRNVIATTFFLNIAS